jgi:hypothetical protein
MTADTSPEATPIATLGVNGAKARFGAAYLRTIFSHAGVGFMETTIDEDVLAIDGKIEFAMGDARVQVKCTGQFRIDGGTTASWPAEETWWIKWHRSKVPEAYAKLRLLLVRGSMPEIFRNLATRRIR